MTAVVTIAAFLAIVLGALGLFAWLERRKESAAVRLRKMAAGAREPRTSALDGLGKRFAEFRKRLTTKPPDSEELVEMFLGKELTGARLLLSQAGSRSGAAYRVYWWTRLLLPVLLALLVAVYGKKVGLPTRLIFFLFLIGAIAGILLPDFYLRMRIRKRQEEITDSLPDAMDLMVVCVEAGMGLNAAFVKISEEFRLSSPVLSGEFDIVNREMVAGKPRQEALRALADRAGVEEVKSLVAMLIQTEKLGTSLSQSLRVHSESLRTRRRQRAEEAAAKTTIKLVFPLVFLLFPALFVVILGPGVIQIINALLPVAKK